MQPPRGASLGVRAGAAILEAGEARGGGARGGHGQRATIPRPIASAAVSAATDPVFAGLARQAELIAAASVPVGFTPEGFPLAVQLVGRAGEEATVVSLAAQIEHERAWADRVPDLR